MKDGRWAKIRQHSGPTFDSKAIKRRSDVVGIFPNDRAVVRLAGALMLEQNDEWAVGRRYMSLESITAVNHDPMIRISVLTN